jgi:hypothetical protein
MICVERNVIPYGTQLVFMEFKIMNLRLCYSYFTLTLTLFGYTFNFQA